MHFIFKPVSRAQGSNQPVKHKRKQFSSQQSTFSQTLENYSNKRTEKKSNISFGKLLQESTIFTKYITILCISFSSLLAEPKDQTNLENTKGNNFSQRNFGKL